MPDLPGGLAILSDTELLAMTRLWRTNASRGSGKAHAIARAFEDEMTRRFGGPTTLGGTLGEEPNDPRPPWWQLC